MSDGDAEHQLVVRFIETRDERTFATLYERHTPRMWGLALRLTGGAEAEASDIVQEAWTRAVSNLHRFRGEAKLSSWLCGICTNVWRERLRRRKPETALDDQTLDPCCGASAMGDIIDVREALNALAPGYRAVVVLYAIYGFSHAEIADLLGISVGTSKSQLSRARSALRAATGAHDRPGAPKP